MSAQDYRSDEAGMEPVKAVQELINFPPGTKVLDMGAGGGRNALYLAEQGLQVTVVEPETECIEFIKQEAQTRHLDLDIIQAGLLDYEPDSKFDIVVVWNVLHFLANADEVVQAVRRLQEMTNPGGLHIISVMLDKEVNNPRPYLFAQDELKSLYAGWDVQSYTEALSDPYMPDDSKEAIRSWRAQLQAKKTD